MNLMLAAKVDLDLLRFPVFISKKLDGIRAVKRAGKLYSRKAKLIPNEFIQKWALQLPEGYDGELLLADPTAPYRQVTSAVMSRDGEPDFRFHVFDIALPSHEFIPYSYRLNELLVDVTEKKINRLELVSQEIVTSIGFVNRRVEDFITQGFEGAMLRSTTGRYVRGRTTALSQELLKLKAFEDEEARVTAIQEEYDSNATFDTKGKNRLGAIMCVFEDSTSFRCGSGFTAEERDLFWKSPEHIIGQRVTIKHQPAPGGRQPGERPRFPVFKGIRYD